MNEQTGRLVILSGPSGVGKDTVIEAWCLRNPRVQRVVSYTTRDPRPGEVDGVDYRFVPRDLFDEMAARGDFLEYKEVHGNSYATPARDVERLLEEGKIAVLKIDVQGALTVMAVRGDAIAIFLLPPSAEELASRIRGRGTEDDDVIQVRLRNAEAEMAQADHYHHRLVNDHLPEVVEQLQQILEVP